MEDRQHHPHLSAEEKEKRRKKQRKRMEKILARAWQMGETNSQASVFLEDSNKSTSLTSIGQKLDQGEYRLGRHGWEDFAADIGAVYNRHISRYGVQRERIVLCLSFLWSYDNDKGFENLASIDSLCIFAYSFITQKHQTCRRGQTAFGCGGRNVELT